MYPFPNPFANDTPGSFRTCPDLELQKCRKGKTIASQCVRKCSFTLIWKDRLAE